METRTKIDNEVAGEARDVASDPATNPRAIPADLKKLGDSEGYIVAACRRQAGAEKALVELTKAGFDRDEIVLISKRVGTLRPNERGDAFEVRNPASEASYTGSFAGGVVGLATGASFGLILSFLVFDGTMARAIAVALGAVILAVLGTFVGAAIALKMRRAPATYFDENLDSDQILVGVNVGTSDVVKRRDKAIKAIQDAGLVPQFVAA